MKSLTSLIYEFLFKVTVFLIPTQLAFHLWPDWSHVFGVRVDYLAPTLYLTDILIVVLLAFGLFRNWRGIRGIAVFLFLLVLVFVSLNIYSAASYYPALLKWLKVGEMVLFAWLVKAEKSLDIKRWIIFPLSLSVIFFSLIGILQFLFGHTLGGPLYFLGERSFNVATPGISRFFFVGAERLRAYSTFSHPNSLAGFLGVSLFLIYFFSYGKKHFEKVVKGAAIFIGTLALFLTVSLGAFLAAGFGILSWLICRKKERFFSRLALGVLFLGVIVSILSPLVYSIVPDAPIFHQENLLNRVLLTQAAGLMIAKEPLLGVGLNNFVVVAPIRFLQPVHNIFLLAFSETGMVGLILLALIFYLCLKSLERSKNWQLIVPFIFIIITGLVDHYWLTLQQNEVLLSLFFGLSLRRNG